MPAFFALMFTWIRSVFVVLIGCYSVSQVSLGYRAAGLVLHRHCLHWSDTSLLVSICRFLLTS
jgi:hypothetical protein